MSKTTYPIFGEMLPGSEDIQLIVDSFKEEDRKRLTLDGIFNPGIVNKQDNYLQQGTNKNTLKILPFIAYTKSGNRIEVQNTYDYLIANDNGSIVIDDSINLINKQKNIPYWHHYTKNYVNFTEAYNSSISLLIDNLNPGAILQGIKLKHTQVFNGAGNVYVSIGTSQEPEKFSPKFLISQEPNEQNIETSNIVYCESGENYTPIYATFYCSSGTLNLLTSGNLSISLCITDVSNVEYDDSSNKENGIKLTNVVGNWKPNTTYYIVARYNYIESDQRSINITNDEIDLITTPFFSRQTDSFDFYALRRSGSIIDPITEEDVKLGKVISDSDGNISIYVNEYDEEAKTYLTDYLSLPGYRFRDGINAQQISSGKVTNEEFDCLQGINYNIQQQINSSAGIAKNNTFTGINSFTQKISGDIDTVDGYHAIKEPTSNSLLVLDENGKIPANAISELTISSLGNIYTITSGKLNENNKSDFLKSQPDTDILVQAKEVPLVLNYCDGTSETITEDNIISGIFDDGKYILLKEKNGNFGFLPVSGGTKGYLPKLTSNIFNGGSVSCNQENTTAFLAFDGSNQTAANIGREQYSKLEGTEEPTISFNEGWIQIQFEQETLINGFSISFRLNSSDPSPKNWIFQARNSEEEGWQEIKRNQIPEEWKIGERKTYFIDSKPKYKIYRFYVPSGSSNINNYITGSGSFQPYLTCIDFQLLGPTTDNGKIVESFVSPKNPKEGDYWLDLSVKPYKSYKYSNGKWNLTYYVKLGEVSKILGLLKDPISYSYNTINFSDEYTQLSLNQTIEFSHNFGVVPEIIEAEFICLEDDASYTSGQKIKNILCEDSLNTDIALRKLSDSFLIDEYKVIFKTSSTAMYVINSQGYNLLQINPEKWGIKIFCKRGW